MIGPKHLIAFMVVIGVVLRGFSEGDKQGHPFLGMLCGVGIAVLVLGVWGIGAEWRRKLRRMRADRSRSDRLNDK